MNKDLLKQYIKNYGETKIIDDMACILQELSQEWDVAGNKKLSFILSDSAISMANIAHNLKRAEENYYSEQNIDNQEIMLENMKNELNNLINYFYNFSYSDIKTIFTNRKEFISKLERYKFLRKFLTQNKK